MELAEAVLTENAVSVLAFKTKIHVLMYLNKLKYLYMFRLMVAMRISDSIFLPGLECLLGGLTHLDGSHQLVLVHYLH